jgi:uncharacterized protein YecT (DUF1311 family)
MRQLYFGLALSIALPLFGAGLAAGQAAAQNANCDLAQDTMSMAACLDKQYAAADAVLNAAYKSAMAQMKSIDESLPKSERGAQDALRSAQRAWIAVRDGTCAAEGFNWVGGSGQGIAVMSCMLDETEARSEVLARLVRY